MIRKAVTSLALLVLVTFVGANTAFAGSLTPPGTPAKTMYTLTDLYNLASGTLGTLGSGALPSTPSSILPTFHTLTEIYTAIATQIANLANAKLASGVSAFGFTGTLLGDTSAAQVLTTAVYPGTYNAANLTPANVKSGIAFGVGQTGSYASGYTYGDASQTKVLTTAAGAGTYNASNLAPGTVLLGTSFGVGQTGTVIQALGNATAANVLSGTTFSNATAANISGTMTARTSDNPVTGGTAIGTALRLTPSTGYYDGLATVSTTSANFIASNIKNGINLFGITGSLTSLDTSDATAGVGDILAPKTAYVNGLKLTGTMPTNTLTSANDTVSAGYYAATTLHAVDPNLAAGNIKSGTSIFGITGSLAGGYTYGDASQAKVLTTAAGAGTFDATNLTAGNVKAGTTFGVGLTGTFLTSLWNGTGQGFTGGAQANGSGGVDDYNNSSAAPSDRYAGTWTACNAGNSYCGTGDAGASQKDNSTGLVWSKSMNASTYALDDSFGAPTWFVANNCVETTGSTCTQKTSSKTGCAADAGWSLPTQKQLMLAYIDGAYGNLETTGSGRSYWSGTTVSNSTGVAWVVGLSNGYTYYNTKTNTYYVRCVR